MQVLTTCPPPVPSPWPVVYAPAFSAFGVFVVGCIAASIAYRQWRTADRKLRLDLYEKRRPVYVACTALMAQMTTQGRVTQDEFSAFNDAVRGASFIFDPRLSSYISMLQEVAGQMVAPWSDRFAYETWRVDAMAWLRSRYSDVDATFRPYLAVDLSAAEIFMPSFFRAKLPARLRQVYD